MKILVTGTAGFIGFHLANDLIKKGHSVVGIDSINEYYDVNLKYARLKEAGIQREDIDYGKVIQSSTFDNYQFIQVHLEDNEMLSRIFSENEFDKVCHLAAQAGVRYSLQNPQAYIGSNIVGFVNILQMCRQYQIKHLVYASSSSVYGLNKKMPLSVSDSVDHPISIYAATKKSNELMAYTYSHLFNLRTTGLRFFTVYGPWGRPDMAMFLFTKAIDEGRKVDIYNGGDMYRDFTYVDDVIEGVMKVIESNSGEGQSLKDSNDDSEREAPYKIYNIGNSSPVKLSDYINEIEIALNKKAIRNLLPMQPGDVYKTYADVSELEKDFGYRPKTSIQAGIRKYVNWYLQFYRVQ